MKQTEMVSIVIPVYGLEHLIRETMDYVRAQTYTDWELILVDDRSPDTSADLIEQYCREYPGCRIRLLRQERNRGPALARNRGVEAAEGRYLAFLDGDDIWEPDKLRRELEFLKEKDAAFVFMSYEFAEPDGHGTGRIAHAPETLTYREALRNTTIFTSTVMFDLEKIPKEKLRMPDMKSEDTALWWSLLREGITAYGLDETLVRYRRPAPGQKSLSSNKVEALRRIWNLYRKAEHLSVPRSMGNFVLWAVNAVRRRL